MNLKENELGYEIISPHYLVFFGGVEAQLPKIKFKYPEVDFVRLKQIHSDAVLESNGPSEDFERHGDSHYSKKSGLGLCVITADCMPVFLFHPQTGLIAGVHAGWRGVASRIVPKTIAQMKSHGALAEDIQVLVGPHIQKKSFEVEIDVKDQILHSVGPEAIAAPELFSEKISETKYLVDLHEVLKSQLVAEGVSLENVSALHIDTVMDKNFHSYRRDKEKSGRQISFIVKR